MICKRFFISVVFIIACGDSTIHAFSLLTTPQVMNACDMQKRVDEVLQGTWGMCWQVQEKNTNAQIVVSSLYQNGKINMTIQLVGTLPDLLVDDQSRFQYACDGGTDIWTYTVGDHIEIPGRDMSKQPESTAVVMGRVTQPLKLAGTLAQQLTVEQCAAIIKDKKCMVYTGAGISAGVVPTMAQLMHQLNMPSFKEYAPVGVYVKQLLENPELFLQPMHNFYKSCLYGQPTDAHRAVKKMVIAKKWALVTENLDLLHARSGIQALSHNSPTWLKDAIAPADLAQIDYIITIGLANDESALLGWYKECNPEGKIIAINCAQPSYVSAADFLLLGDAQVVVPALWDTLND